MRVWTTLCNDFICIYCKPTFIHNDLSLQFSGAVWLARIIFHNQAFCGSMLLLQFYNSDWIAARNIHDDKALTNVAKICWFTVLIVLIYLNLNLLSMFKYGFSYYM